MPPNSTTVLSWPKRLLSADDLRRHLTNQRELLLLPRTVITPLAADELRAKGVRILWQTPSAKEPTAKLGTWIYAQEKSDVMIASAIKVLEREGTTLTPFAVAAGTVTWARTMAETILASDHRGGIVFCGDPALACCIANKVAGMRGVAVFNVPQVVRAKKNLAANLFAIEMPGPTFFEVRQMLKTIVTAHAGCRDEIANVLKELDGHAHC